MTEYMILIVKSPMNKENHKGLKELIFTTGRYNELKKMDYVQGEKKFNY